MSKRWNQLKRYNISTKRFLELSYFCQQYPEWKDELKYNLNNTLNTPSNKSKTKPEHSDPTGNVGIRRQQLERNISLIESTASEVSDDIAKYIIKAVTEDKPYKYLETVMRIPCSRNTYYAYRRKFFWLLDQRKKS